MIIINFNILITILAAYIYLFHIYVYHPTDAWYYFLKFIIYMNLFIFLQH